MSTTDPLRFVRILDDATRPTPEELPDGAAQALGIMPPPPEPESRRREREFVEDLAARALRPVEGAQVDPRIAFANPILAIAAGVTAVDPLRLTIPIDQEVIDAEALWDHPVVVAALGELPRQTGRTRLRRGITLRKNDTLTVTLNYDLMDRRLEMQVVINVVPAPRQT